MGGKLTGVTSDALQQCDRKRSLDQELKVTSCIRSGIAAAGVLDCH